MKLRCKINKTEYDFTNENVTISSIKKTNAFSHLIDFIISISKLFNNPSFLFATITFIL